MEPYESIEECAIREVKEETGHISFAPGCRERFDQLF
ncbi:NUDIX domain-containing protein [Robinsoniella peoriensis]|nr:NUDIX domain-containing protein [Robinsoniella peoriensis]MDU7026217.1 NUDIX domain-containing protein [Clostridiales bacterium]